jgi:hypothetical protein
MNEKIQRKWKEGFVVGHDCITFSDGRIVVAKTYNVILTETGESKRFWFPLCDTTLEGVEKYDDDVWTPIDIFHGSFIHDEQTIVFGDGAMGNEGYIASLNAEGDLNWSAFFTFSNPICKAEVTEGNLVCYGDTGCRIKISLNNMTEIEVTHEEV